MPLQAFCRLNMSIEIIVHEIEPLVLDSSEFEFSEELLL